MDIALLNVRITVQKNETVVDAIGNHKNNWTDYHTCFATVSGEGGSEINPETSLGTYDVLWVRTEQVTYVPCSRPEDGIYRELGQSQ